MSECKDNVATSNKARRPKEIVRSITDTGAVSRHRLNLSEMIISWLKENDQEFPEKKEEVYFTFMLLNETLKDIEALQERRLV